MDPLDTESNASFSNPTTGLPDLSFDSLNEILNEPEIQDPLEQRIKKAEKDIGEGLSKSVIIMTNQRDRISDLEQRLHESNEKIENQSKELSELKAEMTAIKETMKNLLQQSKNRKPPARATKPTGAPAGKQHFHKEPESNRY